MNRSIINLILLLLIGLSPIYSSENILLISFVPTLSVCLLNARYHQRTQYWILIGMSFLLYSILLGRIFDGGTIFLLTFFLFLALRPIVLMKTNHIKVLGIITISVLFYYSQININEINGRSVGLMSSTYTSLLASLSVIIMPRGKLRFVMYIGCFYILSLTAVRGVFVVMLVYLAIEVGLRRFLFFSLLIFEVMALSESQLITRFSVADASLEAITSGRFDSWRFSFEHMKHMRFHELIKGFGSDFYRDAITSRKVSDYPHFDVLYFLMTRGVLGLVLYMSLLSYAIMIFWRGRRSTYLLNSLHTNFFLFSPFLTFLFITDNYNDNSNS